MRPLLFISDLHLANSRPHTTKTFVAFCQQQISKPTAQRAQALYILGDLFDYWVGDDTLIHAPAHDCAHQVVAQLRALTQAGIQVFIIVGNRDFLIGALFAEAAGAVLLADTHKLHLTQNHGMQTAVITHGDALCTDDVKYQQFRQMVRTPTWQQQILAKSYAERIAFAQATRAQSESEKSLKAADITDVNEQAVANLFASSGAQILIHGHTHRPMCHQYPHSQRWVLSDWEFDDGTNIRGGFLCWNEQGLTAHSVPI